MAKCQICNKDTASGHKVSHSMRHTKRQWKPNIQKATLLHGGKFVKMRVCSRCLRSAAKSA